MVRFLFYSFSLYISLLPTHSGFLVRKQAITVKSGEFEISLLAIKGALSSNFYS